MFNIKDYFRPQNNLVGVQLPPWGRVGGSHLARITLDKPMRCCQTGEKSFANLIYEIPYSRVRRGIRDPVAVPHIIDRSSGEYMAGILRQ